MRAACIRSRILNGSPNKGSASYESAIARARRFAGRDLDGYRSEFVQLAEVALDVARGRFTAKRE
jgi:hypothetical protein